MAFTASPYSRNIETYVAYVGHHRHNNGAPHLASRAGGMLEPRRPGESAFKRHVKLSWRAARCDYYVCLADWGLLTYRMFDDIAYHDEASYTQQMQDKVKHMSKHSVKTLRKHADANSFGRFLKHAAINCVSGGLPALFLLSRMAYFTTKNEEKVWSHIRNFKKVIQLVSTAHVNNPCAVGDISSQS
jgi:hypothetical protein